MALPDPRDHAYRPDLADEALRGIVAAPRFASPVRHACTRAWTTIHASPAGEPSSELLDAEHFMVLDVHDGWAWGWSAHDHYVGYVEADSLVLTAADRPVAPPGDPLDLARSFLGRAYVWGGRGGAGIDCSGLVQRALAAKGLAAPRDSDMQRAALGRVLRSDEPLCKLDLVFFPGHVGMMADTQTLIHATRFHGKTVEERLADVVERVKAKNEGVAIVARKRVFE